MRVGCLLSVRAKATRLPNKVFLDLGGKPLTAWLLSRLNRCKETDEIVLSTSINPGDKKLVELASSEGFKTFCGSENDKLARYLETAEYYNFDAVVIVDGDDPFCFPEGVDAVSLKLKNGLSDCVFISGLPVGAACTGLTVDALKKVIELKDEEDTEVWGGYFIGSGYFRTEEIKLNDPLLNHQAIRLTVDYPQDYEFAIKVVENLNNSIHFSSHKLMDLLVNKMPELNLINRKAQKLYESYLKMAAPVKFKGKDE